MPQKKKRLQENLVKNNLANRRQEKKKERNRIVKTMNVKDLDIK